METSLPWGGFGHTIWVILPWRFKLEKAATADRKGQGSQQVDKTQSRKLASQSIMNDKDRLEQTYSLEATLEHPDDEENDILYDEWRALRDRMFNSNPDDFNYDLTTLHGFTMQQNTVVTAQIVQNNYPGFDGYDLRDIEVLFLELEASDRGCCEGGWGNLEYKASSLEDYKLCARLLAQNE
jgi:hypothetical protein